MNLIKNLKVYGLENSIRVSKFPMSIDVDLLNEEETKTVHSLATSPKGEGHDNFLKGIIVQFDLSFTIKAWTEAERYHFFELISSQSTMHKIAKFDLDKAYIDHVDKRVIEIMKELVEDYNNETDPELKKEKYLKILYTNPVGMILTVGISTNYQQLKTIYHQRKNHRLPEWKEFCQFMKDNLPNSHWITENKSMK